MGGNDDGNGYGNGSKRVATVCQFDGNATGLSSAASSAPRSPPPIEYAASKASASKNSLAT